MNVPPSAPWAGPSSLPDWLIRRIASAIDAGVPWSSRCLRKPWVAGEARRTEFAPECAPADEDPPDDAGRTRVRANDRAKDPLRRGFPLVLHRRPEDAAADP